MVLRSCIVLLLLFTTASSLAQLFEGAFVGSDEGYYFNKQGEFSWFHQAGNAKELGSGKYSLTNDSIKLIFGRAQRQFDIQAQSSGKNGTSDATVRVNAIRASGKPFRGLKFVLLKSNVTNETDRSGTAIVDIPNAIVKDNIHFELDGYRTIDLPIALKGFDSFIAVVVDDVTRYRENTVAKFKLTRTKRNITLTGHLGPTTLRKVSRKTFLNSSLGL